MNRPSHSPSNGETTNHFQSTEKETKMAATKLSLNAAVNHEELVKMVATVGEHVTLLVTGEPGVGKTHVLSALSKRMPTHTPIYVDAPVFDIPDIYMPCVDMEHKDSNGKSFPLTRF